MKILKKVADIVEKILKILIKILTSKQILQKLTKALHK